MSNAVLHRPKSPLLALAIAALCQAQAGQSLAQSATPVLEEVIVTGRFQQSLVDRIPIDPKELPFTLHVLDRDLLDSLNFTRPIEALTALPNITRTEDRMGTGTANFLARGFDASILVDNRVQNNFRGAGARDDSFVERYEVLKGPASIALGPISAGGVINTVTKVPQAEQFLGVALRTDHFGSISGEFDANLGDVSGSDRVLLRVNAAYRDFQFDARETRRETFAIRPVVTLDLGAATRARASASYTEHTVNPNAGFPLMSTGDIPPGIDTDTFTGFANGKGVTKDHYYDAELNHEFLDSLKLTVRGSKQKTDFDYKNTSGLYNYNYADGSPGIGLNDPFVYSYTGGGETRSEATFFDTQLAYQAQLGGRQQDFVIGAAYDDRSFIREFSAFPTVGPFPLDRINERRDGPNDIGPLAPHTLTDQTLKSVFAEAALRPGNRLTLIGGIRYDELVQDTTNYRRGNAYVSSFDDNQLTTRLGATYALTDAINAYVSFAQAFAPQFGVRRDATSAGPEMSDGYEIGLKAAVFDNRLTLETAYFHTIRKDVAVRDPANVAGEFFVVTVGELVAKGVELSGTFKPTPGFNVVANLGLTDIKITEAGNNEVTAAVFPELTGSLYLNYQLQHGPLQGLAFGGGLRHVGKREGPVVDFDSYTVTDINVSYPLNQTLNIALNILNVTDESYLENTASFAKNLTAGSVLGPPRTAALTLRAKF